MRGKTPRDRMEHEGMRRRTSNQRGYTLVEILLSVGLLMLLLALAMPDLMGEIEAKRLPESAQQMRSLLTLVRANAMYDGKRYRIRFPKQDEIDFAGERRQPLIERENEPFLEPGTFDLVHDAWAQEATLMRGIRCAEVRLGKPTLDEIDEDLAVEAEDERLDALAAGYEEGYPPLFVETDGTSEWATFVITNADEEVDLADVEKFNQVEVILDGVTGLIWLQRPFFDEEVDMFKEHGWPPVLRRDFLRPNPLTEEEVLEIDETRVRQ